MDLEYHGPARPALGEPIAGSRESPVRRVRSTSACGTRLALDPRVIAAGP